MTIIYTIYIYIYFEIRIIIVCLQGAETLFCILFIKVLNLSPVRNMLSI